MAFQEIGSLVQRVKNLLAGEKSFFVGGITGDKTASHVLAANDGSFQLTLQAEGQTPVVIGVGRPETIAPQILSVRVRGNGVDTTIFRSE